MIDKIKLFVTTNSNIITFFIGVAIAIMVGMIVVDRQVELLRQCGENCTVLN